MALRQCFGELRSNILGNLRAVVAAGDGALSTCTCRGGACTMKSSSSAPSTSTARARTPLARAQSRNLRGVHPAHRCAIDAARAAHSRALSKPGRYTAPCPRPRSTRATASPLIPPPMTTRGIRDIWYKATNGRPLINTLSKVSNESCDWRKIGVRVNM